MDRAERFAAAWRGVGATGDCAAVAAKLLAAYAEPHRAYHTQTHVDACLDLLDDVRDLARRPHEVAIALWYHDAVYATRGSRNEERSASRAVGDLRAGGAPAQVAGRVEAMILATRHAAEPVDPDARLLVDIDLAILGADAEAFRAFDEAVRVEYRWVPWFLYRKRRADVLESFVARPAIYLTPALRARFEARARANLAAAIARLRGRAA